jgi:hypothetical protein
VGQHAPQLSVCWAWTAQAPGPSGRQPKWNRTSSTAGRTRVSHRNQRCSCSHPGASARHIDVGGDPLAGSGCAGTETSGGSHSWLLKRPGALRASTREAPGKLLGIGTDRSLSCPRPVRGVAPFGAAERRRFRDSGTRSCCQEQRPGAAGGERCERQNETDGAVPGCSSSTWRSLRRQGECFDLHSPSKRGTESHRSSEKVTKFGNIEAGHIG